MLTRFIPFLLLLLPSLAGGTMLPADEATYAVRVTGAITYGSGTSQGGTATKDLLLDLYEPVLEDNSVGPLPVVILIHGGGYTGGSRLDDRLVTMAEDFASRGWIAASIDYRLVGDEPIPSERYQVMVDETLAGLGRGVSSDEETTLNTIVSAAEDAATATDWIIANAPDINADAARIGLLGSSAGAFISINAAYTVDEYDIAGYDYSFVVDLWGGSSLPPEDDLAAATVIDGNEPPLFIVHGTADATVSFAKSEVLVDRAQAVGLEYEFYPVEGAGHGYGSTGFLDAAVTGEGTLFDRALAWTADLARAKATVFINPAMEGAWYNPETDGQGIFIDLDPQAGTVFVGWFTFDTVDGNSPGNLIGANQRWFTAFGQFVGNRATLEVFETTGGRFNDPSLVTTAPVGTASLVFSDCLSGTFQFELPGYALEDTVPLLRNLSDSRCETLGASPR
ncbi:MAG: alpha/beta hydrolase [Pseudomonadota bacterium]